MQLSSFAGVARIGILNFIQSVYIPITKTISEQKQYAGEVACCRLPHVKLVLFLHPSQSVVRMASKPADGRCLVGAVGLDVSALWKLS